MKHPGISMTEGSLCKNILFFSFPLMLSNILQVLFNMSDLAVVGRVSGSAALGSVGSCTIFVTLFTGLMIGMGAGINAITARFIGARDSEKVRKTVHSSLLISLFYGVFVMAIGLLVSKNILILLKTKDELLFDAVRYMTLYLLGTPALALYNFGNGVLSAAGDSRRPLLYLTISGLLNIALNLIFVICFGLGVAGVAIASVIAQYLSAFLILFRLFRCKEDYALSFRSVRLDLPIAKSIFLLGLSAGIQNAIFAVANLFVQSAVNSFDAVMVEGNAAAANADALIYDTMAAFYVACTSFIAQNYGAGKKERILKSYRISLIFSFAFAATVGILLLLFGRQFLSLFATDEAVLDAGMKRIEIMGWCYAFSAFMDNTIAASRGLGKTVVPTGIVILGSCVFRIVWVYTVFAFFGTILSLYLLYIFSWGITAVCEMIYFFSVYKKQVKNLK